jgi:hypothetical protein
VFRKVLINVILAVVALPVFGQQQEIPRVAVDSILSKTVSGKLVKLDSTSKKKIDSLNSFIDRTDNKVKKISSFLKNPLTKSVNWLQSDENIKSSINSKLDSTKNPFDSLASIEQRPRKVLETRQQRVSEFVANPLDKANDLIKLDSLVKVSDRVQSKLSGVNTISKTDQKFRDSQAKLEGKATSLLQLNPSEDITKKIDGLTEVGKITTTKKTEKKISDLQANVEGGSNQIEKAINEKLSTLSKDTEGNLPSAIDLPAFGKHDMVNLPSDKGITNQIPSVNESLIKVSTPSSADVMKSSATAISMTNTASLGSKSGKELGGMPEIKPLDDLKDKIKPNIDIKGELGKIEKGIPTQEIKSATGQIGEASKTITVYTKEVKEITSGNTERLDKLANDELQKVSMQEVKALKTKSTEISKHQEILDSYKNYNEYKKQTIEKARKVLAVQFATNQASINQATTKVSEYQKKADGIFNAVNGLPNRPRKSRNIPLIERIVPGVNFQLKKTNDWMVDINPSIRFRTTSFLSFGTGWNERIAVDHDGKYQENARVYGVRIFGELLVKRGFSFRIDAERMNVFEQPWSVRSAIGERNWVWIYMVGIKKQIKVSKKIMGNVQLMYNLSEFRIQNPSFEKFNIRFGFEFPQKRKTPKTN